MPVNGKRINETIIHWDLIKFTLVPTLKARSELELLAGIDRISAARFLRRKNEPLFSFQVAIGSSQSSSGMLRYLSISTSNLE